jgi:hypothetical protein
LTNCLTTEILDNRKHIGNLYDEVIAMRKDLQQNTANVGIMADRLNQFYIKLKHVNLCD